MPFLANTLNFPSPENRNYIGKNGEKIKKSCHKMAQMPSCGFINLTKYLHLIFFARAMLILTSKRRKTFLYCELLEHLGEITAI